MIHTSRQLKALVRNRSGGDSAKAQTIIRNYIMERLLERISLSKYRDRLILKGGMLVSALVGLENRSTMDIDTTMKNLPLSADELADILTEIMKIEIDDGIIFTLKKVSEIMDEAEYPGVRAMLEAQLDTMRTPLKIDISTGDVITPGEIQFEYKLMFEERTISIYTYNIETVLAEKLETVISRGTANTRLRDFYDLYILQQVRNISVDELKLKMALEATSRKRASYEIMLQGASILEQIYNDTDMKKLWINYQKKYDYARDYTWDKVMESIKTLYDNIQI
ncbi:MAG TPA: nucleotidyl transferase AbiEii/AbiGii toxin family protein [Candidatus Mediterraneibacter cottocaccae]|nr:nucleotidyl transferase AbiEii/AbiGii toxin family protein [Candidatus Mediterraneibacter cottocaccae]